MKLFVVGVLVVISILSVVNMCEASMTIFSDGSTAYTMGNTTIFSDGTTARTY